jgi:mannose-6-phosphate isomerase-like protein (cupin superfamily)
VGDGGGTTFRINEWAPGHARFTHRTETLDYAIVLSGETNCELENGEAVHLKSGDVMIQRGTIHTWVNRGSVPAVTAFILIDAKPSRLTVRKCALFSRPCQKETANKTLKHLHPACL